MPAPAPSVRQTPAGKRMGDGFGATLTFSLDPDIEFEEMSVTGIGVEADDPHDVSTNFNVLVRTYQPGRLVKITPAMAKVRYDPAVINSIFAIINKNQTITVHHADTSSDAFYGILKSFKPDAEEEGKAPEATVETFVTNRDPSDCSEQKPVHTAATGTGCF